LLIWHGRRVCIARRPLCRDCVLVHLCPAARVPVAALLRPDPALHDEP
jgi:endonuclease-3